MNMNHYVKINSDNWDDIGKVYRVSSFVRRDNSTATELTILNDDGTIVNRVVPFNQIEWAYTL